MTLVTQWLGHFIRSARTQQQLSIAELSILTDIPACVLDLWERGHGAPTHQQRAALTCALEVNVEHALYRAIERFGSIAEGLR